MIEIKALASGSAGNCYLITDGVTPLLLECGIPFKEIQKGLDFKTSDIKGVLVTHEHKDHSKAVKELADRGLDIYMSPGTAEALGIEHFRIKPVANKKQFTIGTWTVLPFDVQHDVAEPYGFLLVSESGGKLLFLTDTFYCKYKFSGVTHLMLEVNYSEAIINANVESGRINKGLKRRIVGSHMSLENALEFLEANDLSQIEEIHLLHLSNNNSDEALFKSEVQKKTGSLVFVH